MSTACAGGQTAWFKSRPSDQARSCPTVWCKLLNRPGASHRAYTGLVVDCGKPPPRSHSRWSSLIIPPGFPRSPSDEALLIRCEWLHRAVFIYHTVAKHRWLCCHQQKNICNTLNISPRPATFFGRSNRSPSLPVPDFRPNHGALLEQEQGFRP